MRMRDSWGGGAKVMQSDTEGQVRDMDNWTAEQALEAIHGIMDGTEWDSDTLDYIQSILYLAGFDARDPQEFYEEEGRDAQ